MKTKKLFTKSLLALLLCLNILIPTVTIVNQSLQPPETAVPYSDKTDLIDKD